MEGEKKYVEKLSFIAQFKFEFLLMFTGCREVVEKWQACKY